MFSWLTRRRRARAVSRPFPPEWRRILETKFAHWRRLTDLERLKMLDHIRIFLDEKRFEGCGGLELTDEMRLLIAAQACLLILHRRSDYFPMCTSILVYPSRYRRTMKHIGPGGVVTEVEGVLGGESWQGVFSPASGGPVILNWPDVESGALGRNGARSVVIHEFAHQLDGEGTGMDGAPVLDTAHAYQEWARVMGAEYRRLVIDLEKQHPTLIDAYGATNPPEFFAVVTEHYFAQPEAMKQVHPELFATLDAFYRPRG